MIDIKQAKTDFVSHLESLSRSRATVIAYRNDIDQLIEHLTSKNIKNTLEVQYDHLKDYTETMVKNQDMAIKTISRKINATRTFFKYLHEKGHVLENIADKLKHPKVLSQAPRILSRLEYGALRDAARNDIRALAIIELLLQAGLRISEIAEIMVSHVTINGKEGMLKIPEMQSQPAREVPLNEAAVEAIKTYQQNERPKNVKSEILFVTKSGKALLIRNIRATIDRYFRVAGVKNAKVNDLRHTFVAHHLKRGVSLQVISKIAGHKRISTTEKYLQYIEVEETNAKTDLGVL